MESLTIESSSDSEQRIDKFLKKYLPLAPLSGIYKWLRTGKIKVNRKKVEQTYKIEIGDCIDIHLSLEEIQNFQKSREIHDSDAEKKLSQKIVILYEDEHLLILNKAPGINVHPGDHKTKEVSLIEMVQDYLWKRYNTLSFRPSLVHRIDRDTSGAIMIAKDKPTLEKILWLLQWGNIEKIYHALVLWVPKKPRDTINAKLLRREDAVDEAKVLISEEWQEAITHYKTLIANIRNKYSLLEVRIETGRTHQIRVHLSSIGHPIIGDKSYGDKGENSFAKREYSIERQMLHAYKLSFIHPETKKLFEVTAPYHDDMSSLLLPKDTEKGNSPKQ
jgi:23S rRNA pseudouridine955/2504/2580 synthase